MRAESSSKSFFFFEIRIILGMVSHPAKAEMTKVRMTKIFSSIDRFVIRLAKI